MKTTRCDGCGKPIFWAYTERGKPMPLDPDPVEPATGTYVVSGKHCRASQPMFDPPQTVHYMNHWTTCTHRDEFRRPK
jgi:hypothetical protein